MLAKGGVGGQFPETEIDCLLEYGGELTAMASSEKVPRDQGFPATFDACHVFFTIRKY